MTGRNVPTNSTSTTPILPPDEAIMVGPNGPGSASLPPLLSPYTATKLPYVPAGAHISLETIIPTSLKIALDNYMYRN